MTALLSDVVSGFLRVPDRPPVPLWICDSGRPLWPERWNWWRHASYTYRITAIAADGTELPVTISPAGRQPGGTGTRAAGGSTTASTAGGS